MRAWLYLGVAGVALLAQPASAHDQSINTHQDTIQIMQAHIAALNRIIELQDRLARLGGQPGTASAPIPATTGYPKRQPTTNYPQQPSARHSSAVVKPARSDVSLDPRREQVAHAVDKKPKSGKTDVGTFYFSIGSGLSFIASDEVEIGRDTDGSARSITSVFVDFATPIFGAVGYEFASPYRLEFELGYRNFEVDRVKTFGGTKIDAEGSVDTFSFALNGYRDIEINGDYVPYVGLGVGLVRGETDVRASNATTNLKESAVAPLLQAMAGVTYQFNEHTSAFAGYRLAYVGDVAGTFTGKNGSVRGATIESVIVNEVNAGIRYGF